MKSPNLIIIIISFKCHNYKYSLKEKENKMIMMILCYKMWNLIKNIAHHKYQGGIIIKNRFEMMRRGI